MADENSDAEKTEDPTQKRLDDALERGDVAKSQEVNTWFVLAGGTLALAMFSASMGERLLVAGRGLLANAGTIRTDGQGLVALTRLLEMKLLAALALPFLIVALAAIIGNIIQHRLVWSAENLKPKASKISPLAGAKRLFSKQALANFLKGLIKIALIGAVMLMVIWPQRTTLDAIVRLDPAALLDLARSISLQVLGTVVAVLAVVAAGDYLFQYRQWFEKQKMSLQEIKEEFKQTEGDPHIKGKMRQLRQQRMRKRMMAAVPSASVVITNPTHFSVALKYDKGMAAPVCVAKGADAIAFKIREVAKKHDIPIIESPPLARALFANVDIDEEIPVEHYQAVAEIIGYVMKLRRAVAGRRP